MWLLIDDERSLGCDVIARNAKAAYSIMDRTGYVFDGLCIDHDLGEGDTGYDILQWAINRGVLPKKVQIVTMNPVGRQNMARALLAAGYKLDSNEGIYIHE